MTKSLVTIGITAFNAESTVAQALGTALMQTWRPIEIFVVDDASTDNTQSVINAIAAQHDTIRVVSNTANSGVALARNKIVDGAKGEFLVFFDDDDVSRPDRVERQVDRLLSYEREFAQGAPVVCHSAREQIYADGTRHIERTMGVVDGCVAPSGWPMAHRILMGRQMRHGYGSCATCSQMARTDVYRMLGGFDPAFRRSEDTEFCVRLARSDAHFPGIATPLVVQSMTKTTDKDLAQEKRYTLAMLEKHRDLFEDRALYDFCRDWIELKHLWLCEERMAFAFLLAQLGLRRPSLMVRRLYNALPSMSGNLAYRRFHKSSARFDVRSNCHQRVARAFSGLTDSFGGFPKLGESDSRGRLVKEASLYDPTSFD
jgi:glycosyltransferase involved in cell wall biosynthesis